MPKGVEIPCSHMIEIVMRISYPISPKKQKHPKKHEGPNSFRQIPCEPNY